LAESLSASFCSKCRYSVTDSTKIYEIFSPDSNSGSDIHLLLFVGFKQIVLMQGQAFVI